MPRQYYDEPRDEEYQDRRKPKTPWTTYLLWGLGILVVIFIIFFAISASGNLKSDKSANTTSNVTQPTQIEQLTAYVIAQQSQGMGKEEIVERLKLAGYNDKDIETAFKLSDNVIQYILSEEKLGKTKQQIIEDLLAQGIPAEEITIRYQIIDESRKTGISTSLKDNWMWILLGVGLVVVVVYMSNKNKETQKLTPKIYTLDECEEHAREYLTAKGKSFNPSKQYRNRPEVRQYRFVYEEPLFPEFNDHQPTGHRVGHRLYYFIAIGYDNDVIDYHETHDDNKINLFLYSAPKGFETSGSKEYMGLKRNSEQPVEEMKQRQNQFDDGEPYGNNSQYRQPYRRPYSRVRPGPVTGYERP